MISAQRGGITGMMLLQAEKELGCGQREVLFSWFLVLLVPCSKRLVLNCAGSSSFCQRKQKESGGSPKYKTLEGCSKNLCSNGTGKTLALCRGTPHGLCHPEEKDNNSGVSLKAYVLMG